MVTHFSILAWRIPQTEGAWRAAVHGVTGSDTTEHEFTHIASPGCLYHTRDLEESFKK